MQYWQFINIYLFASLQKNYTYLQVLMFTSVKRVQLTNKVQGKQPLKSLKNFLKFRGYEFHSRY